MYKEDFRDIAKTFAVLTVGFGGLLLARTLYINSKQEKLERLCERIAAEHEQLIQNIHKYREAGYNDEYQYIDRFHWEAIIDRGNAVLARKRVNPEILEADLAAIRQWNRNLTRRLISVQGE